MMIPGPRGRNAADAARSVLRSLSMMQNPYLFCVTELPPPQEPAVEETKEDRREREAARLDMPPPRPGEDPPSYGDEGGGNLYPEGSFEASAPRMLFFERVRLLAARLRRGRL
jgi:hypothetical protein